VNEVRVVDGSLVVLMGPSGSGKTTWAVERFGTGPVVSADALRAVVGEGERDVRASTDAFELLEQIVDRRLGRGLLTVVDTLGMDDAWRERWLARARRHGRPAVAVVFDVPEREVRRRNRARPGAVPSKVLTGQLERWAALRPQVDGLGFDEVLAPGAAVVVPAAFAASGAAAARQRAEPVGLRFGLLVGRWDWPGESAALAERLGDLAVEAEQAGFDSLWVMDHLVQVPTVGREWEAMPEAVATLGFLAARTTSLRLGPMVSPVTLRHPAVLGRAVATLDVLSGGRAVCGLGVGSHPDEHLALGLAFPPLATRYELLEDALRFLPLLWGAGAPSFHATTCASSGPSATPAPSRSGCRSSWAARANGAPSPSPARWPTPATSSGRPRWSPARSASWPRTARRPGVIRPTSP
jgi:predicted kinase